MEPFATEKVNVLSMTVPELQAWCLSMGEKPFRAKQLVKWVHQSQTDDFSAMTDLAKGFRDKLQTLAKIQAPAVTQTQLSKDGTCKWLFDVGSGNVVESVFIPETNRGTLCISSQAGCAVNCRFCSTGKQGFSRNLNTAEIIGQLWYANRMLKNPQAIQTPQTSNKRAITNVVMMGMGEPLLNYDAVLSALQLMLDDSAYGLSRRRVTVSTSGVVPFMDKLAQDCPVALAVSLHAPNNTLRDHLVPLNKKYPLEVLLDACLRYLVHAPRDFITFEYCMLDGINDAPEHAKALLNIAKMVPCKFNLIPFNPFPASGLKQSKPAAIKAFLDVLLSGGVVATVRKTRGDDIDAACGQLAGEVQDRTRIQQRLSQEAPIAILKQAAFAVKKLYSKS